VVIVAVDIPGLDPAPEIVMAVAAAGGEIDEEEQTAIITTLMISTATVLVEDAVLLSNVLVWQLSKTLLQNSELKQLQQQQISL
jgi:hypothetical protein